jgi:uncharacterized membrane protein YkvA (DUF1232 family)
MGWTRRALRINAEVLALLLACRDPRTPWYAKALAICVVAYALSPIDLIPDFIPGAGYIDDLILVPLGIVIARRLIPTHVLSESRQRADEVVIRSRPLRRVVIVAVIVFWILLTALAVWLVAGLIRGVGP